MIPVTRKYYTLRQKAGALLIDWPRLIWAVLGPTSLGALWMRYGNREDRLTIAPDGAGVCCEWEFSRDLHLCHVFPAAGRWLLHWALQAESIQTRGHPDTVTADGICRNGSVAGALDGTPEIAFLIGHRGRERLPLLLQVLESIAAQQGVSFECVVVEQDVEPTLWEELPAWVRYVHTPPSGSEQPFSRSWAFNIAAAHARAPLLVFHDNDILVPVRYGAALLARFRQGYEAITLKRFVFYLDEAGTAEALKGQFDRAPAIVVENLDPGGSLAVERKAFEAIGGYDEDFVGWGGEDIEFWDRCLTRRVWRFTELPFIHLWHAPQPGKQAVRGLGLHTADLTEQRRALPPEQRIAELVERPRGQVSRSEKE